jgi:hypothetical protein
MVRDELMPVMLHQQLKATRDQLALLQVLLEASSCPKDTAVFVNVDRALSSIAHVLKDADKREAKRGTGK